MKICRVLTLLSMTAFGVSFNANAEQYRFVASDNSVASQVCVLVGSNDVGKLKSAITKFSLNKHHLANSYRCNELPLSKFAYTYSADNTFKYINRYSHFGNKVKANVTISDLAMVSNEESQEPIIIRVSSTY